MGDGRQSGTAASPSILNISPESAVGGNLALLETDDEIKVDLNTCQVNLLVTNGVFHCSIPCKDCWQESSAAALLLVDFTTEDAKATLEKLSAFKLMRGIRQQLHWHQNPQYCFQSIPDLMNQSTCQSNFSYIQEYGWTFELQVFASQMKDAARLASQFPETTMILQDKAIAGKIKYGIPHISSSAK